MTPIEIAAELKAVKKIIGAGADVYLHIDADEKKPVYFSVYADGICKGMTFAERGSDFAPVIAAVLDKWESFQREHNKRRIREMALAIIRITAEHGQCTDAALRSEFYPIDVSSLIKAAVEDANEIAGNGPFSVVAIEGANDIGVVVADAAE